MLSLSCHGRELIDVVGYNAFDLSENHLQSKACERLGLSWFLRGLWTITSIQMRTPRGRFQDIWLRGSNDDILVVRRLIMAVLSLDAYAYKLLCYGDRKPKIRLRTGPDINGL